MKNLLLQKFLMYRQITLILNFNKNHKNFIRKCISIQTLIQQMESKYINVFYISFSYNTDNNY